MKLQSKNYEILNKQKLQKKGLHLLAINMFFIQKLINNNLFKNNHIIILWNVLQVISFQNCIIFACQKKIFWKGWHTLH